MHRIDGADTSVSLPTPAAAGTPGYFKKANVGAGTKGTIVTADWANSTQEEICTVIEDAGLTLDKEDNTQLNAAIDIKVAAAAGAPTGVVFPYAGSSAPSGFLLCDGSAVSRTTYADLFTAISTAFGVGDGSTTFNLPDMRGRLPVGKDNMGGSSANRVQNAQADILGGSAGTETHTLTTDELPSHSHEYTKGNLNSGQYSSGGSQGVNSQTSGTATSSTGGGSAHNNMPPYLTLNYIIKT